MAKRFTETDKWTKNKWFRKLNPKLKLLWLYLLDSCDAVGVWEEDLDFFAVNIIGVDITIDEALSAFSERVTIIKSGKKWLINDFVTFQYGNLSKESKVHVSYINLIQKHGLFERFKHQIVDKSMTVQALRQRLTSKVKQDIIIESNYCCQYCGDDNAKDLLVDHIVSLSKGGDNEPENLTAICPKCNVKKSDGDVFEFIENNEIKPLDTLCKKLHTLSNKLDRVKEKEKETDKEEEQEEDKDKEEEMESKKPPKIEITLPFTTSGFTDLWKQWKVYKKEEHKFSYKTVQSEQASLNELAKLSGGDELIALQIILQSMSNGWKGFFELKQQNNVNGFTKNGQQGGDVNAAYKEYLAAKMAGNTG